MILTTTPSVEGRAIAEHKGVVFGEVVSGVNFIPAVNQIETHVFYQQRLIVIPKSVHKERMIQNLDTLDFNLTEEEMADIRSLDTGYNLEGWPSDALKYNPKSES